MTPVFRDLRYVRVPAPDLDTATAYGSDILGLMIESAGEEAVYFRSDARNHSLCYTAGATAAVALTVADRGELDQMMTRLEAACHAPDWLDADQAAARQVKAAISVAAPNGVMVDIVWRPLTSGWPFHGPRATGITGLQAVQMACSDVEADEDFWTRGIGGTVSDWAGRAAFVNVDGAHHRVALYPSDRDGLLGVTFGVGDIDHVMRNWYFVQDRQLPVVHGPGCQPTSGASFVTTRGAGDLLYTFATAMADPDPAGPRQFPDAAQSHCAWGSPSTAPEFSGGTDR